MNFPEKLITTSNKVISVKGKVFYNDKRRRIDLKKPIKDLFGVENLDIFYTMEMCLSKDGVLKRVTELSEKNVTPVILYFSKKGGKEE